MFLKAKSIILKAFLTCGSKFSSITFELHFDYIFCIFLQSPKLKTQAKNRQYTVAISGSSTSSKPLDICLHKIDKNHHKDLTHDDF